MFRKNLWAVFAALGIAALVCTACPGVTGNEKNPALDPLRGVWDSGYSGDKYTITDTSLSYGDSMNGTIRHINAFNSSSGVIIIEYTKDGKQEYYDYDENWNITGGPFDPPGNFQGVYYKELSAGSVKMGNANDASKSGRLAAPETATLAEAINKFSRDAESRFMSFYGTYSKVP